MAELDSKRREAGSDLCASVPECLDWQVASSLILPARWL